MHSPDRKDSAFAQEPDRRCRAIAPIAASSDRGTPLGIPALSVLSWSECSDTEAGGCFRFHAPDRESDHLAPASRRKRWRCPVFAAPAPARSGAGEYRLVFSQTWPCEWWTFGRLTWIRQRVKAE